MCVDGGKQTKYQHQTHTRKTNMQTIGTQQQHAQYDTSKSNYKHQRHTHARTLGKEVTYNAASA
jgi:hypothetical protein